MLDTLVHQYWSTARAGGAAEPLRDQVVEGVFAAPPSSVLGLARALQVLDAEPLPGALQRRRGAQLVPELDALRASLSAVDDLVDPSNDPRVLFELLGDGAVALSQADVDSVRQLREARPDRGAAAGAVLGALADGLPPELVRSWRVAEAELRARSRFPAWALLVDGQGQGFPLGLWARAEGEGVRFADAVDSTMLRQAEEAWRHAGSGGAVLQLEWALPFVGESIGAAVVIAGHVLSGRMANDALLAATGAVDLSGNLRGVEGIAAKLTAAANAGCRRVVVPEDNRVEAEGLDLDLTVIAASHVDGIPRAVQQRRSGRQLGHEGRLAGLRGLAGSHKLQVISERPVQDGHQLRVADLAGEVPIMVYRSGRIHVAGKDGRTKQAAEALVQLVQPPKPETRESLSINVAAPAMRDALQQRLLDAGAIADPAKAHEQWRCKLTDGASTAVVVQYASGSCVVTGKAPAWETVRGLAAEVLGALGGSEILTEAPPAQADQLRRAQLEGQPWIGTDESGKGDYFGPLVSAAVAVDTRTAALLESAGVMDSKRLSDRRIRELAEQIRSIVGSAQAVTAIHPPRFNTLQAEMRARGENLNTMVAWGHTRSIENVLLAGAAASYVIVDKFGDVAYVQKELLSQTRQRRVEILQWPKAEADVAVAAASILAREAFMAWLERTSDELGLRLPKGSGPPVIDAARLLVARDGEAALSRYAKVSFATTRTVLADP